MALMWRGLRAGAGCLSCLSATSRASFSFRWVIFVRDWCPLGVYSLSPSAIGARYGYILFRSYDRVVRPLGGGLLC
eukprot:9017343-Pyramimonas_sp.AAC.1